MIDPQILHVEERLAELHLPPGRVDGVFTKETAYALWTLQKLNGIRPVSKLTPATLRALQRPRKIHAPIRDGVVVDLSRQVLFFYDRGRLRVASHVSTGAERYYCMKGHCGYADTPLGDYRVFRRVNGWDRGPLGAMYKTMYFNRGIAMHGSKAVPRWPASHGCVRLPMHIADRLYQRIEIGTIVRVRP